MAVEESMGDNKSENSIVVGAKVNKCGGTINLSLKLKSKFENNGGGTINGSINHKNLLSFNQQRWNNQRRWSKTINGGETINVGEIIDGGGTINVGRTINDGGIGGATVKVVNNEIIDGGGTIKAVEQRR